MAGRGTCSGTEGEGKKSQRRMDKEDFGLYALLLWTGISLPLLLAALLLRYWGVSRSPHLWQAALPS